MVFDATFNNISVISWFYWWRKLECWSYQKIVYIFDNEHLH